MTAPNNGLFVLRRALEPLANEHSYDVVVIDLGPVRGAILATALAAAHAALLQYRPRIWCFNRSAIWWTRSRMRGRSMTGCVVSRSSGINTRHAGRSIRYLTRRSKPSMRVNLLQTIIPVRAPIRYAAASQQSVFQYSGADAEVRGLLCEPGERADQPGWVI